MDGDQEALEEGAPDERTAGDESALYSSGLRGFGETRPVDSEEELPALPWASAIVRPYARTGGRTRPDHELAVEALISTGEIPDGASVTAQGRMIIDLCREPRSVAEVAALLGVPLGVARVLLGDLATEGAVVVHATTGADVPDVEILRRVLVGLRRL
ncbi:DUF742 domain-containing protein [Actinophytocola xanthii]|uniref:DUF742 domain-containing protein n=1 Tax=Actinophytocola xanthii TaxID=1912961 RepID=UPI0009FB6809|nr:DUF742 domain-containing protein [Actinophytocola xanthii]